MLDTRDLAAAGSSLGPSIVEGVHLVGARENMVGAGHLFGRRLKGALSVSALGMNANKSSVRGKDLHMMHMNRMAMASLSCGSSTALPSHPH